MNLKKLLIYPISLLGAAGTGLQNYLAVADFIRSLMRVGMAGSRAGLALIHSLATVLGGICSGLVNFCINIELLEAFHERITKKKRPKLQGWEKFRYWAGSGVFILTGILFGLTALAFGPVGVLYALSAASGIFVSIIMMIQELETWLESFDKPKEDKQSLMQVFREWKASLTKGKLIGTLISVGNVLALSVLFTLGLGSFFIGVGVPALPAVITSICLAFTGGAFTEFYFYNKFLSNFCDTFKDKWQEVKKTKWPGLGIACGVANGVVNGALAYAGVMLFVGLLASASIAVPPFGAIVAIAVIAAVFASSSSCLLGMDFWIRNSKKLTGYFSKDKEEVKGNGSLYSKIGVGPSKQPTEPGASATVPVKSNPFSLLSFKQCLNKPVVDVSVLNDSELKLKAS